MFWSNQAYTEKQDSKLGAGEVGHSRGQKLRGACGTVRALCLMPLGADCRRLRVQVAAAAAHSVLPWSSYASGLPAEMSPTEREATS